MKIEEIICPGCGHEQDVDVEENSVFCCENCGLIFDKNGNIY